MPGDLRAVSELDSFSYLASFASLSRPFWLTISPRYMKWSFMNNVAIFFEYYIFFCFVFSLTHIAAVLRLKVLLCWAPPLILKILVLPKFGFCKNRYYYLFLVGL